MQADQLAKVEAAVILGLVSTCANPHPLVEGLEGCRAVCCPGAFSGGRVGFSAVFEGVVGDLMVGPQCDHGLGGVQVFAVWIDLALGRAHAVIGQTQNFIDRFRDTVQGGRCGGCIPFGGV